MSITIRPATEQDIPAIVEMVNQFAAKNIMLPRSEASIRQSLPDWLVAVGDAPCQDSASDALLQDGAPTAQPASGAPIAPLAGCGSLVPLTDTLVEIRSLAIHEAYQGQGVGSHLVHALVEKAREQEYEQVCALTLREGFFTRLGFAVVDRWSISPKVWQACIDRPKFHHCDEIAVLMPLVESPALAGKKPEEAADIPPWNGLLRWDAWQPLKLAYQQRPGSQPE